MEQNLSKKIWTFTVLIITIGLVCLYSASFDNVRVSQKIFYDQLIWSFIGFGIIYFLSRVDYRKFYDAAYIFYVFNVLLLIWVHLSGRHALGARRWIDLGILSFQPSEVTKISLILVLARYYSDRFPTLSFSFVSRTQRLWRDLILPFIITAVPMLLVFKQPDLGTSILLFGIFCIMLFVSGIDLRYIFSFWFICACLVPFGWHFLKDYQKDRLLVFLNPNIDPLGAGYTIIQSKIAVGSGQIFGKGWLAGTQNQLNFLPERHTDFIFSVLGEEWGLLGGIFLLICYFFLIQTGFYIAERVKDKFGMLVIVGAMAILALQVIINIGMVIGVFPVVGITLPLVSYGRTSFLIFVLIIGFLLNISKKSSLF